MRLRTEFLIWINSVAVLLGYCVIVQSIVNKSADVTRRITDSELRIAEQQQHITRGNCAEAAMAATMLHSAASTL